MWRKLEFQAPVLAQVCIPHLLLCFVKCADLPCRDKVESEVERYYIERLQTVCYRERMHQQQLFRWGQRDQAKKMELPSCAELTSKFGYQQTSYVY